MDKVDPRVKFMASLAKLCVPERAVEATTALCDMLPMLADVPAHAWASRSALDAVATCRKKGGVPSYAEIQTAINAWRRENPSPVLALEGDPTARLSNDARMWLRYWHTRQGEGFGAVKGATGPREHVLSFVKSRSPEAWSHITGIPVDVSAPTDCEREQVAATMAAWRAERGKASRPFEATAEERRPGAKLVPRAIMELAAQKADT